MNNKVEDKPYIVIKNGCIYKKGTILIKHNDGYFAPSLNDYPIHCHFLTEKFIISKPLLFKKINNEHKR
jgi:hypothetical protein